MQQALRQNPIVTQDEWSYVEAFSRNAGLITENAQQILKDTRVAIPGLGGVGGVHLITLARLGIGKFRIADYDTFGIANTNRQYGANIETVGRNKAEVMAEAVLQINPEIEIDVWKERIDSSNASEFLDDVDFLVDGVDFFNIKARRHIFRTAKAMGIWALTAGPVGFSTAWLVFSPDGLDFDRYFDLNDKQTKLDQLIAFAIGLAPKATHMSYMDLDMVDPTTGKGPSCSLACQLSSGVIASEVLKIVLNSGKLRPVPCYAQFDPFLGKYAAGRLVGGNRHPMQRLKRRLLNHRFAKYACQLESDSQC